jgi:hypothetical protein
MATLIARPVRARTDDYFFGSMALVMLGTVLFGFAHSYFLAGMVMAPLASVLVHFHGAAFVSWIVLFVVQTVLIGVGKVRVHRTLGWVGAVLAPTMMVLGILTNCAMVRRGGAPPGFTVPMAFMLNNLEVILFAALVGWAIVVRYERPIHKRLMLLATLGIMGPAISRWPLAFVHSNPIWIPAIFYAEVLTVLVYDLVTRHKPYWQTVVATVAVMSLFWVSLAVSGTAWAMKLLAWVVKG